MKMINNVERIKKLKEENYQKIFGIKKNTFDKMLKLLNESYRIEHSRGDIRQNYLFLTDL